MAPHAFVVRSDTDVPTGNAVGWIPGPLREVGAGMTLRNMDVLATLLLTTPATAEELLGADFAELRGEAPT